MASEWCFFGNLLPQLLQELCTVFNVDLPCRVKSSQLGIISNKQCNSSAIVKPQPSSCSYICQHCLVHLGDIGEPLHSLLFFSSKLFIQTDSASPPPPSFYSTISQPDKPSGILLQTRSSTCSVKWLVTANYSMLLINVE